MPSKLDRLRSKVTEAIRRDGDGYRGRTGYLDGLLAEIIEAARDEGRREARPPLKVRRGLSTLAGIVSASTSSMMIGREHDAVLTSQEQTTCDNIDAACAWIWKS